MATRQSTAITGGIMPDYTLPGLVLCRTARFTAKIVGSGETIEMIPIPKGAKIVGMNFAIDDATAVNATGTEVGDGGSNGRFFNAIDISSVGAHNLAGEGVPGAVGYEYPADDTIDIFVKKETTDPATGANWILNVFYKMAGSLEDEDNLTNY